MQVIQVYMHNMLRNFNYIAYSEKSKEAIFFDPLDVDKTLEIANNLELKPKYLINTHTHHDHIHDNQKFLDLTGAKHIHLKDGEVFKLSEGEYLEALDTPGHVMNHQCFLIYAKSKPIGLISGDALFNAGVGNCKNGGDVEVHFKTIYQKLRNLPKEIKIYPSHDYLLNNLEFAKTLEPKSKTIDEWIKRRSAMDLDHEFIITTMEDELQINPFLRLEQGQIAQTYKGIGLKERFIEVRKLRDNW